MHYLGLSLLSVLAAVLLVGPAAPLRVSTPRDDMIIKHKWDVIPDNWHSLGPPPDDTTIDLHIALQPSQVNALTNVLHEVSQPGHPKYGAHLSREQVAELVAPHPDTLELVISWLEHNGVPTSSISTTHDGGWLTVSDVPISRANELLGASYRLYYHAGRNDTILRTIGYALPAALHVHVRTVIPTTAFTPTRPLQQTPPREVAAPNITSEEPADTLSSREEGDIIPSVLRSLYGTENYVPPVAANSRLGIVGYDNDYPSISDLRNFLWRFRREANEHLVSPKIINDNVRMGYASQQANVFLQFAVAMTWPIPITFYNGTGTRRFTKNLQLDLGGSDVVHDWLKYTVEEQNIPQTIGLLTEGTYELGVPQDYAEAVCNMLKTLGARGVSVLAPSGDAGVGAGPKNCHRFSVTFPASCPYVTSVGGTTGSNPEVASFFSGGGFSDYFPILNFQKSEVENFIGNLDGKYELQYPTGGGRGVPDIAMQSSGFALISRGKRVELSSTVCSTSIATSIFSMINDYRLFNHMEPLGWLNPWLYGANAEFGIIDITSGKNPGCKTEGFEAGEGWDPVTGLGSPDFANLKFLLGPIVHPPQRRNESSHDQP